MTIKNIWINYINNCFIFLDIILYNEYLKTQGNPNSETYEELAIDALAIITMAAYSDGVIEKQEEYFENLFKHLDNLENKLGEMDGIMSKLNDLEMKVEKYREKTPQEKLELRSLDSGPYKQNLADFFDEKKDEMEATGKNEYVLTQDDVESFSPSDIEKSFTEPMQDEDDILLNRYNS